MNKQALISVSGRKDKEPPSRNKQMKSSAGVTATTGVELVHHPTTGSPLVGDEYTIEEPKAVVVLYQLIIHHQAVRVHDLLVLAGRTTTTYCQYSLKRIPKATLNGLRLKVSVPARQEPSPVAPSISWNTYYSKPHVGPYTSCKSCCLWRYY
jgi:hypothetical protein